MKAVTVCGYRGADRLVVDNLLHICQCPDATESHRQAAITVAAEVAWRESRLRQAAQINPDLSITQAWNTFLAQVKEILL